MSPPRGLSDAEAAAWEKLAATVEPLHPNPRGRNAGKGATASPAKPATSAPASPRPAPAIRRAAPTAPPAPPATGRADVPRAPRSLAPGHLDSHWDKRLKAGEITPDVTLDLHDHGLDAAYARLMDGMEQAIGIGARVVLVVAGRSRPVDPADRSTRRGAIRAKILDWLAASAHGSAIAAIRKAHRRHGGDGAIYIVLRRMR